MAKKIDEETMLENIENLRSELSETKGFLQTYMLDPDPDSRPAEDERLKTVVRLAGEMEDILAQLTGGVHTEEVKEETPEETEEDAEDDFIPVAQDISEPADDINLEYKTHELGTPGEDEDNIEADWNLNEEDMMPAFRAYATSEELEEKKKEKKAKKDKKKDKKKAKKDKKKDKKKAKKDKKSKKMNKEAGLFADVETFE